MPRTAPTAAASRAAAPRTAPVLAVLVCHDGEEWLPAVLESLRALTVRPRHIVAVDTGSEDRTAELLAGASELLDGVLTLPRDSGFGAAVAAAVEHGEQRWGDPGTWVWLLHDDAAPEPSCLDALLSVAEVSPSAALLGPLCVDWSDPRMVIEAGVSTDSAGNLQTGIDAVELDLGQFGQNSEVLAVSSAGALVRRDVWSALDGYDPALALLRDDLDFGWRVNQADHVVLCVPSARLRHVAALGAGRRTADATEGRRRGVDRSHGVRTYLVNCSTAAFVVGVPRLALLCLFRALVLLLVRRVGAARAELTALGYLLSGRGGLRAARRRRRGTGIRAARSVRGLLTSRVTRLRNGARAAVAGLVRRRVQADAALGRLPAEVTRAPVGPDALPDGAAPPRDVTRRVGGLRRPVRTVAVPVPPVAPAAPYTALRTAPPPAEPDTGVRRPRPSPAPRSGAPVAVAPIGGSGRLVMVDVGLGRAVREILLAPPVLLVVAVTAVALVMHRGRLALDLAGGRLLPLEGLGETWASYLAGWHPVGGGSGAPASAALALAGLLGTPVGSPAVAVSLLLLAAPPLAALSAYLATRRMPVPRSARALVAAAYALVPAATAGLVQGRLDVVVAHVLLPPVLAGTVAVLRSSDDRVGGWLSTAAATAVGLAVLSAFTPVLHLLVLAVALIGFVVAPAPAAATMRRAAGLFTLVLLPLGLLLPWPAVVVQRPAVVVHGVGAPVPEQWPGWASLLSLDPGGPGVLQWTGLVLVAAAVIAALLRPTRGMLPGAALVLLGLGTATAIGSISVTPLAGGAPRPGFTGSALLLTACGLLWVVLQAFRPRAAVPSPLVRLLVPVAGGVGVAALAVGAALSGTGGALDRGGPAAGVAALVPALSAELEREGTSVLVVGEEDEPVWLTRSRTPRFGDAAIAPLRTTVPRLERTADALRRGEAGEVGAAIAAVGATGVEFIVLPRSVPDGAALSVAQGLATAAPPTLDGRQVLRVTRPSPGAELLGPQLAAQARSGSSPPVAAAATRVGVQASPPTVAVRVAPGAAGRLLVLAANEEPGWRASVDGEPVPVVRAWGHQVAVGVPGEGAEVRVDRSEAGRTALLLGQAAIALLALGTAIPARRRVDPDE